MDKSDLMGQPSPDCLASWSAWLGTQTSGERRRIASAKQVAEWLSADPRLRQIAETAPQALDAAFAERGIHLEPQAVRPLWDRQCDPADLALYPAALAYLDWSAALVSHRAAVRELAGEATPAFAAWRARTIARLRGGLVPLVESEIVHAAAAFELASGCSAGCRFCAFGAAKLGAVSHYDPAFMDAFADHFGHLPPTTSARCTDEIGMTRRLIGQIKARGGGPLRASILTIGQLRRLHAAIPLEDQPYVATAIQVEGARRGTGT